MTLSRSHTFKNCSSGAVPMGVKNESFGAGVIPFLQTLRSPAYFLTRLQPLENNIKAFSHVFNKISLLSEVMLK